MFWHDGQYKIGLSQYFEDYVASCWLVVSMAVVSELLIAVSFRNNFGKLGTKRQVWFIPLVDERGVCR